MVCNMVSPMWDWEHLIIPNLSKPETDNKQQPSTEWETEKGVGIESIFPCVAGLERVSTGLTNGFLPTSVSRSSQLTSTNSSSPKVKLASESSRGDSCSNMDFEQVKASTALELLTPSVVAGKKPKSCGQSMQVPRCQIDGCELDLSSAKDYHRKHRVCENHSKCAIVTVCGMERRFCQQCSRLHAVSEFDEKKRSCRKRLSHHNARRRKPQGMFPLNPERVYNRRQHTNMLWNELSLNTRWEDKYATYDTKATQKEGGFTLSFQRGNGSEEHMFSSSNLSFSAYQNSGGFSTGKSNSQLPSKGVGEYSGGLHERQDFYSALSLLSTSSGSHGTKHHPMVESQPIHGTFPTHFI